MFFNYIFKNLSRGADGRVQHSNRTAHGPLASGTGLQAGVYPANGTGDAGATSDLIKPFASIP
jgi:hypothetical protein